MSTGTPTPIGFCPKCGGQCYEGLAHACPTAVAVSETTIQLQREVERLDHLHRLDHALADQWKASNEKLLTALANLVHQLDKVHADPKYQAVWTLFHIHGGDYYGPRYVDELDAARAVLKEME